MAIHLVRIDNENNIYRFYRLDVQLDLFGSVSVIREWGRIGQAGTVRMVTRGSVAEAEHDVRMVVLKKQRRGYHAIH